jgi:hypothetical protein
VEVTGEKHRFSIPASCAAWVIPNMMVPVLPKTPPLICTSFKEIPPKNKKKAAYSFPKRIRRKKAFRLIRMVKTAERITVVTKLQMVNRKPEREWRGERVSG